MHKRKPSLPASRGTAHEMETAEAQPCTADSSGSHAANAPAIGKETLPAGLEPATLRLTASRSNQLSYGSELLEILTGFAVSPGSHRAESILLRSLCNGFHAKLCCGQIRFCPSNVQSRLQSFSVGRRNNMTLAGLEPAIFGSEDQRLIH